MSQITDRSIVGSGASAEPIGKLVGGSAVRAATQRFGIETTPDDYFPIDSRSALSPAWSCESRLRTDDRRREDA